MIDTIVQTLAVVLLCWGLWETGNKKVRGPVLAAIAELFVIVVGITHGAWSVTLIGVILFFIQSRNAWLWMRGAPT